MEMDRVVDEECCDLYKAVKSNQPSLVRELVDQTAPDFNKCYGKEGSILNVAIENAGVEVVANLLQVEYPVRSKNTVLPKEKYDLLGKLCGDDQLTPLMYSVKCEKGDIASFLLDCGVDVNEVNKSKMAAVDFVSDGGIALSLFKADSLFHSLGEERGRRRLEELMNECEELKKFFERRDALHEAIKKGESVARITELIDTEESQYLINSKGQSALWQAAYSLNADVWAYLNAKRLKCTSRSEECEVNTAKSSYDDRFGRSMLKYFFEVKGTHVMKMVTKSRVFGENRSIGEGLRGRLRDFYESLDDYEETQILLEVLQDEHDFEVIFDFDSTCVKYVCAKSSSDKDWGLTDFRQKRVYVGAKEGDGNNRCDILGTLSHELGHKALWVVFQNNGKPYREDDLESMQKYQTIVGDVMSKIGKENLDDIINRVTGYPRNAWEQELIVRVPEIVAKYCPVVREEGNESDSDGSDDGIDILVNQVEPLLNYYRVHVMDSFREYVANNFTSNKMTVKTMSDYQKLLLESVNERVSVGSEVQDIEKHIHNHNGLRVIVVSNVPLCYSHLKMLHQRRGENILLVDWSQYSQPKSGYLDGLSSGAFDLLIVRWDTNEETPKFCRRTKCRDDCMGDMFGGLCSHVILVLTKAPTSLRKVNPLEYTWTDLSESTKSDILRKKVNFMGCMVTMNDVISGAILDDSGMEAFMENELVSGDISFFLQEENITVGKMTGWADKDKAKLFQQSCYMKRHLSERSILFSESLLGDRSSDLFVVCNASFSDLEILEISSFWIKVWDPLHPDKKARCFLVDQNDERDIIEIFDEICSCIPEKKGVHLLEYRGGDFLYLKSHGSLEGIFGVIKYESEEMKITEREFLVHKITSLSETETCDNSAGVLTPVIVADEPGCGKSFILNNFVSEFRRKFSSCWMSIVDLNFHAQIKSPVQLNEIDSSIILNFEEVTDLLFRMVGQGNSSFERTLFKHYCRKPCKVIILFDGFDEICPKYRENVIYFLEALRMKSAIKLCVSTRVHERHELEKKMKTIAYKLVPFSEAEQVDFLCQYWNARLKKYRGEDRLEKMISIESGMEEWLRENFKDDGGNADTQLVPVSHETTSGEGNSKKIDFEKYAKKIINNIDHLIKGFKQFTQIPLNIAMIGFVIFEDNFKIGSYWDLGLLYQRFFEIKLEIFKRDKALASGNVSSEKSFSMAQKRIHEVLENLSANIFFDPNFCVCDRNEMYDTLSLGLTLENEEAYQFIHRTFGEFFFAKWLFREAQRESVTKFWLEQLFLDKGLFRVRWFLEDILQLHYSSMESPKTLKNSVVSNITNLCPTVLPKKRLLECLHGCFFAIIGEGSHSLLQYFANGYGQELIKLFMEHKNFPSGSAPSIEDTVQLILTGRHENPIELVHLDDFGERTFRHPKIRQCKSAERYNAFTLVYHWHCTPNARALRPDKTFLFVQKMFVLIEEHQMLEDLNKVLLKHGFGWILPPSSYSDPASYRCYFSEVVKFLTGKNMPLFQSSLKEAFLHEENIWDKFKGKNITLFSLMSSIANGCLDDSQFKCMFLVNKDFLKFWLETIKYGSVEYIEKLWVFIVGGLSKMEDQLNFLLRDIEDRTDIYHPKYVNTMTNAVLSNDLLKVNYIWQLATGLMKREEFNEWFISSMTKGRPKMGYGYSGTRPPVIFKFLRAQLIDGDLDEDEVVELLLLKDTEGSHFVEISRGDYAIESLWLFYELLTDNLKLRAGEILTAMQRLYFNLIEVLEMRRCRGYYSDEPLSDVMVELQKITSTSQSNLIDELNDVSDCLEDGSSQNTQVFISVIVLIYKYLELGKNCIGSELLHKFLKSETVSITADPNILYQLLRYNIPNAMGFVCDALLRFVNHDDVVDLLFMKDWSGDSVFHIAARGSKFENWGKLYDTARILLGEGALSEVHSIANKKNQCVQDLFLMPKKKFS